MGFNAVAFWFAKVRKGRRGNLEMQESKFCHWDQSGDQNQRKAEGKEGKARDGRARRDAIGSQPWNVMGALPTLQY